ncbi:hypothetical protein C466_00365 [Halorubrum distributum JCM 10118]|nr:hypothetical protein C466_00365 [Halorubrum distributum JCM 10118]
MLDSVYRRIFGCCGKILEKGVTEEFVEALVVDLTWIVYIRFKPIKCHRIWLFVTDCTTQLRDRNRFLVKLARYLIERGRI